MTNQDHWFNMAKQLYEDEVAEPVFWLGDDRHYLKAKKIFGDNVIKMLDAVHKPHKIDNISYDGEYIDFFSSKNYSIAKERCFKMMDRIDIYYQLSRLDREVYFNNLVIWSLKKINQINPDVFVCVENPHSHAQYLIFEICNYLGIPTFKFNNWMPVPLIFLENIITGERIKKVSKLKSPKLENLIEQNIKDFISQIIEKKEKFELFYMESHRKNNNFIRKIKNYILNGIIKDLKEIRFNTLNYLRSLYDPINPYNITFLTRRKIQRKKKSNLKKELNKVVEDFKYDDKYVYFPLHFEPERTTLPDGKEYHDQFFALVKLRNFLPPEIRIVVKEHPSQFLLTDRGPKGRSPLFYNLIKNIKNLTIVDTNTNSIELLLRSEFITTITGSVALEASILGKKTLTFGNTWYNGCPNTIKWNELLTYEEFKKEDIKSTDQILNFLFNLKNDYSIPVFLNFSQSKFFKDYNNLDFQNFQNESLVLLMKDFFENKLYNNK